jgi:hypothetical protein
VGNPSLKAESAAVKRKTNQIEGCIGLATCRVEELREGIKKSLEYNAQRYSAV